MLLNIFVKSTIMDVWSALIIPVTCFNADKKLNVSWRRSLSYRKQSIDFQSKSMDWFLHDRNLRHEKVKYFSIHE